MVANTLQEHRWLFQYVTVNSGGISIHYHARSLEKHMYFRYDTATGKCEYRGVGGTSPGKGEEYTSFANIGYHPGNNGLDNMK